MRGIIEIELERAINTAEKYGYQCLIITPEDLERMTRKGKAGLIEFLTEQLENYKEENHQCKSPYL